MAAGGSRSVLVPVSVVSGVAVAVVDVVDVVAVGDGDVTAARAALVVVVVVGLVAHAGPLRCEGSWWFRGKHYAFSIGFQ